jgi:hypothetical protein
VSLQARSPLLTREEDGLNRGNCEQPGPCIPSQASWGYRAIQPLPLRHAQGIATGEAHQTVLTPCHGSPADPHICASRAMQVVAGGLERLNEDGRDSTRSAIALIPASLDDSPEGYSTPRPSTLLPSHLRPQDRHRHPD